MKKIFIILYTIISLSTVQAITPDIPSAKSSSLLNYKNTIKIPEFSVIDINGKTHNNNTIKGKYLIVNFWATWCPPCRKEIPALIEFYSKNSDIIEILGVNYEQANIDNIIDFTDTYMVNYPIILSDENNRREYKKFGEVIGLPTTYIYAPNGSLADYLMGEINVDTLNKVIH